MSGVTLVDVEPGLVIGMRKKGSYAQIANMIPTVYEFAMERGAQIAGPPIYVCHETDAEEAKRADASGEADIEVVIPVLKEVDDGDEVKCYRLDGGRMAKIVHRGAYHDVEQAYAKLFAWLAEQGRRIAGNIREVYMNDPRQVPPEELVTEIFAPID